MKEPFLLRLFEVCILDSWWVLALFLIALFVFEKGLTTQNAELSRLNTRLDYLRNETVISSKRKKYLYDYINSQENPRTIEFVLMQKLGLVPENHIKICFSKNSESLHD